MRIRAALSTLMGQRPIAQSLMDARERLPWSKLPWSPLTVLTYHHVEQPDADYRFDPDVADATTEMFDSQMAWVAANFSVVRLADLARAARGGTTLHSATTSEGTDLAGEQYSEQQLLSLIHI